MKRLFCAGLLLLAGCAPTLDVTEIPATIETYGFDFRPYSEQGFLFTPNLYQGEYESIGIVSFAVWPRARRQALPVGGDRRKKQWVVDKVDADDALRAAYERASAMGADALTEFTITPKEKILGNPVVDGLVMQGLEVSGFAIKRR